LSARLIYGVSTEPVCGFSVSESFFLTGADFEGLTSMQSKMTPVLLLLILSVCALSACDFLGAGKKNVSSNDNENPNSNSNNNGNTNTNSNKNDNTNTDGNDNDNTITNTNDNDNIDGNGNDNSDDEFAVFTDPATGFTTTVVYDASHDTAQFRVTDDSVVFQDGMAYDIGEWDVNGLYLDAEQFFVVQFGTEEGQRRAFFTETEMPEVICDFFVEDGDFQMVPSTHPVPGD
jgi:hypothetical protein